MDLRLLASFWQTSLGLDGLQRRGSEAREGPVKPGAHRVVFCREAKLSKAKQRCPSLTSRTSGAQFFLGTGFRNWSSGTRFLSLTVLGVLATLSM